MSVLTARASVGIAAPGRYLDAICDRLASFEARMDRDASVVRLVYPFGEGRLAVVGDDAIELSAAARDVDGLARIKDLLATAVEVHAKAARPVIVWRGDLADQTLPPQFRLLTVAGIEDLTPHMRRFRLSGQNLGRFGFFGGLHIRMLFPTSEVPDPVWPVLAPNGRPEWPDPRRQPPARVYTVRRLDVAAGWMDIDFVLHGDEGEGSRWAMKARPGDVVGVMGPVGRPVRAAGWYVLAADETGLPALGRILENAAPTTRGVAIVEVAGPQEQQPLAHPAGVEVVWLHRDAATGAGALAEAVKSVRWPTDVSTFGWFAAEGEAADAIRRHWRQTLSLGRDQTLVAAYWRRGAKAPMAG